MINVSIIIKAYNEEKYIANCIGSALKALKKVGGKNEVILVDSLSKDKTVEIAKKYPIRIVQLRKGWQKSAAAVLQTGYIFSKGKYIYVLDGDMTLDENFIKIALKKLKEDKEIAGVGGKMLLPKNNNFVNKRAKRIYEKHEKESRNSGIFALAGGGLYKKSAIEKVGFLANPYLYCYEEADLGYRLEKTEHKLTKLNIPSITHYGYGTNAIKFVFSKFTSKYFQGTGQLLRYYFGKKIFWKHLIKEKMSIIIIFWWLTLFISIILLFIKPAVLRVHLILSLFLFLFILLKKKSISDFSYSILSWTLAGISIIIGFMKKSKDPLSYPRDAIIIKDEQSFESINSSTNQLNTELGWGKRVKVILATNYYYPSLGGITISVDNLYRKLKEKNIDVMVYAFPYLFRLVERQFEKIHASQLIHKLFGSLYILNGLLIVLINQILGKKVIIHGHSANFCALFAYLGSFFGSKSVFTFRTDLRLETLENTDNGKKKNVFYLNKIQRLTAVSEFLRKQVIGFYNLKNSVKVIYNGIPADFEQQKIKKYKRTKNSLLFVGNLIKVKDPLTFIKAIKILKDSKINIKAKIIGIGNLEDKIKQAIRKDGLEDNVVLLGKVNRNRICKHFCRSSVYVCSSIGEGLSNTIIEAIACGTRVVATSVGGIPEIGIEKYGCGKLVTPNNPVLMAKAIKSQFKKKSSKGSHKLLNKFDWEPSSEHYINLYKEVCE